MPSLRLGTLVKALPWRKRLGLLALLVRGERVPLLTRSILVWAGLYLLSLLDLVPDFIPVIGHLDDALVLSLALWLFPPVGAARGAPRTCEEAEGRVASLMIGAVRWRRGHPCYNRNWEVTRTIGIDAARD